MFSQKRQPYDFAFANLNPLHLVNLVHTRKPDRLQNQFQRRVHAIGAGGFRHDQVLNLMSQLKQRLKHDVVLMTMRDEHIIDRVR